MTAPADALLPALYEPSDRLAVSIGGDALTYVELAARAAAVAERLEGAGRAVVIATPTLETVVGVLGALAAGVAVIPISPSAAAREIEHIVADSRPDIVLAESSELPSAMNGLRIVRPRGSGLAAYHETAVDDPERTALILYTSGTTGVPKGVQIPRRAISSNLDALAHAWEWSAQDRLVHALPLFHVHGLVLGTLGPLRAGGQVEHLVRFSPDAVGAAIAAGASMFFGVPTMYHRIADACEASPELASSFTRARILVSGSAGLPAYEHHRVERLTGQRVVERYGMTETVMNTATRSTGERRPGYVGPPLDGVELRLIDEAGSFIEARDDETIGEIVVRGPNLFSGYLNRDEETAEAMRGGWFHTGDMATISADGYVRIVGRRSTDIIKSGGFKIGAGEVEGALLEHPAVAEAAVKGEPDSDLGERVVAWIVLRDGQQTSADELLSHTASMLSRHKQPREIYFVDGLPRNAMGKVIKKQLGSPAPN